MARTQIVPAILTDDYVADVLSHGAQIRVGPPGVGSISIVRQSPSVPMALWCFFGTGRVSERPYTAHTSQVTWRVSNSRDVRFVATWLLDHGVRLHKAEKLERLLDRCYEVRPHAAWGSVPRAVRPAAHKRLPWGRPAIGSTVWGEPVPPSTPEAGPPEAA